MTEAWLKAWTLEFNCPCCGTRGRRVEYTTSECDRQFVEINCNKWIRDWANGQRYWHQEAFDTKIIEGSDDAR